MVYQSLTPPVEEPFHTPMESIITTPTSPTAGYFPPASVWGAQRASQVDLSTRSLERGMEVIAEVDTPGPESFPGNHFPFGTQVVETSVEGVDGDGLDSDFSPALPESPALIPETPSVTGSPVSPLTRPSDSWPSPPSRNLRRLNRKLPPSLTESLEMLVHASQRTEHVDALGSVPEESTRIGSPTRPPLRPVALSTVQKLQQLQQIQSQTEEDKEHRRTASASYNGKHGRPVVIPRSPSLPSVPTTRKLSNRPSLSMHSRPSLSRLPLSLFSTSPPKMTRADSSSSGYASSSHSNEWVTTPMTPVRPLPSAPLPTPAYERDPMDLNASTVSFYERPDKACFEARRPPDVGRLLHASELEIVDEGGERVRFGDIIGGTRRTVVIFVRHWLSSFCAQYIKALIAELPPAVLAGSRARLVIIGNGAPEMIAGFKQHFHCPFPIYTDPSRRLHDALGLLPHPLGPQPPKGDYVVQNAMWRACETLQLAAKLHGFRSGHREQLGAEFIFDGSLRVVFSHRMGGAADHTPVAELREALNADTYARSPAVTPCRSPAASRSCLSLAGSTKEKKNRSYSDSKSERPRRPSHPRSQTLMPSSQVYSQPIESRRPSLPRLHTQPLAPPVMGGRRPSLPIIHSHGLSPITSQPQALRSQPLLVSPKSSTPTLAFPLPPLRVSEAECSRWDQQRKSLLTRRSKTFFRRPNDSAVTIVNPEDHALDSNTGEVVRSVYVS